MDRISKYGIYDLLASKDWDYVDNWKWEDIYQILYDNETDGSVKGIKGHNAKIKLDNGTELKINGSVVKYGKISLENDTEFIVTSTASRRDYLSDMLDYLPWYEKPSLVFKEILKSYDRELKRLEQDLNIAESNIFLDSVIDGLSIYERDFNVKPEQVYNYRLRRDYLMGLWQSMFSQTTEESIKETINFYAGRELDIEIEQVSGQVGMYIIKFVGELGIPANMDKIKSGIERIWPAHLGFGFSYKYLTWGHIGGKKWSDLSIKSWEEVRTWKEVV